MSEDKIVIDDLQVAAGRVVGTLGRALLALDGMVGDLVSRLEQVAATGPAAARYDGAVLGVDGCRAEVPTCTPTPRACNSPIADRHSAGRCAPRSR